MSGNVWEWVWDWWGPYPDHAQTNPMGATAGDHRVVRGGSWLNSLVIVRSVGQFDFAPSARHTNVGFRLVRL